MNSLLAPAIALMNRLSYGMKFCLISVLFFVPLLVVSSMLVKQSFERVQLSQHALDSLELVRLTQEVVRRAEVLRDLDLISFHLGQGDQAAALEQRTLEQRNQIIEALRSLPYRNGDATAADMVKQRDELLGFYARIGQESIRARADMSSQAYGASLSLLSVTASYAGLLQDFDALVRQLGALVVDGIPQVTGALGHGRAVGGYAMGQGYLSSDASREMDDLVDGMGRLQADYQQALGIIQSHSDLAGLRAAAEDSLATVERTREIFEEDIILANSLDGNWAGFFQRISSEIDKSYELGSGILNSLERVLEQRLGANTRATVLLVVALVLVIVLIIYLYAGFYMATRRTLKKLSVLMGQVARGDMTVQVEVDSRDELGALAAEFNDSIGRIRELIRQVGQTSNQVQQQSEQVESISAESSQAVAAQRSQIEQVATAMNEMAATSQEVARSAALAVNNAEQVNTETLNGRQRVEASVDGIEKLAREIENSVNVINRLADDSASISRVLDVIKGVAEQTNLLALNAAIEAARAGEQGRGFAVVADEVRTLARRTQESTEEIEQMIVRLQDGVGAAVKAMGASHSMTGEAVDASLQVQQALGNILAAVTQIVDQSQQIAAAAEQQTAVSHDIDQNIVEINHAGERTAEGARQAEQSSNRMGQLVQELQRIVSAFRV
ncbi:methyl-accepting chemotaxis protein [Pseudomonas sp. WN033]|nr:methyl-accepting chemotaxis protein [Pseudomonas sp. WN033]